MRDYMEIGTTPVEEECIQVGQDNYWFLMRQEAERYKVVLEKRFDSFGLIRFRIKQFPHDFGSYMEVCAVYNDENREAEMQAIAAQDNQPMTWSDDSVIEWDSIKDGYMDNEEEDIWDSPLELDEQNS